MAGAQRCARVAAVGAACGTGAVVCEAGSACDDKGMCARLLVKEKGVCGVAGKKCDVGLVCAGREGMMRCETPLRVGDTCGFDPRKVCESGARCRRGTCFGKAVGEGGECGGKGVVCGAGLICRLGICRKAAAIGERCGHEFAFCRRGLSCVGGVCKAPVREVGQRCNVEGTVCRGGVCAGRKGRRRCVKPRDELEWCDIDFLRVCRRGLLCGFGRCRRVVGEGVYCRKRICEFGLRCEKRLVEGLRDGDRVFNGRVAICVRGTFFRRLERE